MTKDSQIVFVGNYLVLTSKDTNFKKCGNHSELYENCTKI